MAARRSGEFPASSRDRQHDASLKSSLPHMIAN